MPAPFISILFMALSVSGPANSEALSVNKNQVLAATIVKKPAVVIKYRKPSSSKESRKKVKSESL